MENFHGYSIDSLSPAPYFTKTASRWKYEDLIRAENLDQIYRERDPAYMRFLKDFIEKFRNADLLVFTIFNPIHPEVLERELKNPVKILGFGDDPFSTYVRGIPYLWAFDGVFSISPSYNGDFFFQDAFRRWGCNQTYWWPLVWPNAAASSASWLWPLAKARDDAAAKEDFFSNRDIELIYIGAAYGPKVDRLARLRKHFGSRFKIYGRWPHAGYAGMLRALKGKTPLWTRVAAVSDQQREELYYRAKMGINMHLSDTPMETGNMRMYEVPAHGVMLLSDKAGLDAQAQIYVPDKEAVFYDSVEDAIEKIEHYLKHDDEREKIARAGFARMQRDYDGESNLKKFLDWASALPRKNK
jgi:glycosyltransferase involved in cell wall biosynthesis